MPAKPWSADLSLLGRHLYEKGISYKVANI